MGRRNHYVVHAELAFRHPAEAGHPVGALLEIFARPVGGDDDPSGTMAR